MPQKKYRNNPIETVKKTIANYGMLKDSDSVLVSISGGPDSVFLTHALLILRDIYNLKLFCFHLDHMTRNGQSAEDASFVEELCRALDLKLFKKEIDAHKWCRENKLSFQEGARLLRINFLSEAAISHGIQKIAVGHTADDSIETFFINLLRGSGMSGLGGIKPVEKIIIRPLIECARADIKEYLDKNGIKYCTDKTNLENTYMRNKIRNQLLTFMRENISRGFEKRIMSTMKILREEDKYLSHLAEEYLAGNACFKYREQSNKYIDGIAIALQGFGCYPDAFKRRVIIAAIGDIKGDKTDIKCKSIEDALKFVFFKGENKTINLADGIIIKKEYDTLEIYSDPLSCTNYNDEKIITGHIVEPGNNLIAESLGIKVFSEIIEKGDIKSSLLKEKTDPFSEAYIDYSKICFPLHVRKWMKKEGESFIPLGMKKHKKLHDFFIDEKVPESARIKIPIFSDTEKIIWVGGCRIDERVKVGSKTKKILYIKIFKI